MIDIPDINRNDSERLKEICRVTTIEVKTVGGISAASALDMIAYIRELEAKIQHPLNMLLFCPNCGLQHIDAPDPSTGWDNPPHKSHTCRIIDGGCGIIWRPSDVRTNGVATVQTKGNDDTWPLKE